MQPIWLFSFALAGLLACSFAAQEPRATAELKNKDGKAIGHASFRQRGDRVFVRLEAKGLAPGLHAVHVHAVGKCDAPGFTSAGGHFNPANKKHGLNSPAGAHGGDLPNMLVGKDGAGAFAVMTDGVSLKPGVASVFDSDGSALIIHAGVDDHATDPTGNAGDRVGCGLIVPVS